MLPLLCSLKLNVHALSEIRVARQYRALGSHLTNQLLFKLDTDYKRGSGHRISHFKWISNCCYKNWFTTVFFITLVRKVLLSWKSFYTFYPTGLKFGRNMRKYVVNLLLIIKISYWSHFILCPYIIDPYIANTKQLLAKYVFDGCNLRWSTNVKKHHIRVVEVMIFCLVLV